MTHHDKKKTQKDLYYEASRKVSDVDCAMLDLLYGTNPITDEELSKLIKKRPNIYGRFAGYIGKRKKNYA